MRLIRITTLFSLLALFQLQLQAQEIKNEGKPGCQPSNCGPKGTKTEEAAVVSKLRTDLMAFHQSVQQSADEYNLSLPQANAESLSGKDDQESMELMARFLSSVHTKMISAIPENRLSSDFVELNFALEASAAKTISKLSENVALMESFFAGLKN